MIPNEAEKLNAHRKELSHAAQHLNRVRSTCWPANHRRGAGMIFQTALIGRQPARTFKTLTNELPESGSLYISSQIFAMWIPFTSPVSDFWQHMNAFDWSEFEPFNI